MMETFVAGLVTGIMLTTLGLLAAWLWLCCRRDVSTHRREQFRDHARPMDDTVS